MTEKPSTTGTWLGKMGEFRTWCLEKGMVITKKEKPKRKETHLLLDGGKLCVPESMFAEFYEAYHACCFCKWERLYVVEMKSEPFFAMLAEVDFKFERALEESEIIAIAKTMQSGMEQLAEGIKVDTSCVVLTTNSDKCKDAMKSGLHVVWRNMPVDLESANLFRTAMRLQLEIAESEGRIPKPLESWSNTLDPAIFDKNGLRMVRSRKAGVCPQCKGRSVEALREKGKGQQSDATMFCSSCQNQGKVDLGRPYDLLCAMNPKGEVDAERTSFLKENTRDLLLACTIRYVQKDLDKSMCITKNSLDSERVAYLQRAREKEKKGTSAARKQQQQQAEPAAANPPKPTKQKVPLKEIPPSDEKFKIIASLIKEKTGAPDLTHLKQSSIGDLYIANTSCRFCPNKNGEHASSTNFFVIKVNGIQRRCYCMKPDLHGSESVTCRNWASAMEELPLNVAQILFSKSAIDRRKAMLLLERGQSAIMRDPPKRQRESDQLLPRFQTEMTPEKLLSRIERQGGFKLTRSSTPAIDQSPPPKRKNRGGGGNHSEQNLSCLFEGR